MMVYQRSSSLLKKARKFRCTTKNKTLKLTPERNMKIMKIQRITRDG